MLGIISGRRALIVVGAIRVISVAVGLASNGSGGGGGCKYGVCIVIGSSCGAIRGEERRGRTIWVGSLWVAVVSGMTKVLPGNRSARESREWFRRTWVGGGPSERAKAEDWRMCFVGWVLGGFFTRTARWRTLFTLGAFNDAMETGLDVGLGLGLGVGLAVGFTDMMDAGRPDVVGLLCLLTGLDPPFDFESPNPKSLLKNPGFFTFCYANSGLKIAVITRGVLTGGG